MNLVHITFTTASGTAQRVPARVGESLMLAAQRAGLDGIAADCGGCLSCATCHVYLPDDWVARLPAPDADEAAMLDLTAAERRPGSRLACQLKITTALDGLQAHLPDRQY
jgi:2Fe-2S ferredoxin